MEITDKDKKTIKAELKKHFGTSSLTAIRKELKSNAVNQYGCYFNEIKIGGGITVAYTSNPNHFAKFYFKLQLTGMVDTMAFTEADITPDGKKRGCAKYFIF